MTVASDASSRAEVVSTEAARLSPPTNRTRARSVTRSSSRPGEAAGTGVPGTGVLGTDASGAPAPADAGPSPFRTPVPSPAHAPRERTGDGRQGPDDRHGGCTTSAPAGKEAVGLDDLLALRLIGLAFRGGHRLRVAGDQSFTVSVGPIIGRTGEGLDR
jgi:hypothetical protein